MSGRLQGIDIATEAGAEMTSLDSARAIPGMGLEGDRYARGGGFYSDTPTTPGARELTLIEEEAIEEAARAAGVTFGGRESRRNLVTRGVDLKALLGKRFAVGEVVCEGVRECPPCTHLDGLTGKRLMPHLTRTGGLRARIVEGGTLAVGDPIEAIGEAEGPIHGEVQP
jgi:MOSC domain-containing protein YiiM